MYYINKKLKIQALQVSVYTIFNYLHFICLLAVRAFKSSWTAMLILLTQ